MLQLIESNPYALWLCSKANTLGIRYDAWYVVLIAVLLALAATVMLALAVWCVVKGHGSFTGQFRWLKKVFLSVLVARDSSLFALPAHPSEWSHVC